MHAAAPIMSSLFNLLRYKAHYSRESFQGKVRWIFQTIFPSEGMGNHFVGRDRQVALHS